MGSVLFRLIVAIALRWGLNPNDLKLVTAVFVFGALVLPTCLDRRGRRAAIRRGLTRCCSSVSCRRRSSAGTPNEVRALQRRVAADRGRLVRHRHRHERLRKIDAAQRGRRHASSSIAGTIAIAGEDVTRWPEHRRRRLDRPRLSEPLQRHRADDDDRREPRAGRAPRAAARPRAGRSPARMRSELRDRVAALNMGLETRMRQSDRHALRRPAPGAHAADGDLASNPSCCCSTSTPPPSIRRAPTRSSG